MTTLKICLILMTGIVGVLAAQNQTAHSSKIEKAIKSKEPGWKFSSPAREAEPKSTFYRWTSGKEWIDVRVFVLNSPAAAHEQLMEFGRHIPVPPKAKLQGFGDEALLWQSPNTTVCTIMFRRANVFVQLGGSSSVHAKRFLKHLDEVFSQE